MTAELIMIQGVSSNAGKSIFTGALCRYFANRGLKAAPFKPILVCTDEDTNENGMPSDTRFLHSLRAARLELAPRYNPMQILPKQKDWLGQLMSPARLRFPDGTSIDVPMFGRDTPLFPSMAPRLRERIVETMTSALASLREVYDVVVIEGAGNPTDLGEDDLTNFELVRRFDIPTVLVTKLSVGGGAASLVGTFRWLPERTRNSVVGFVLNDFLDGREVAERLQRRLTEELRVPCLGIYPNLWSVRPWETKDQELDGLASLVERHIDLRPLGLELV